MPADRRINSYIPNFYRPHDPTEPRQGYLAYKRTPTSLGPPQGPRHRPTVGSLGGLFLVREVPLYTMQHADPYLRAVTMDGRG